MKETYTASQTHAHAHTAVILYMHAYSCTAAHSGAWICFKHTVQLYSRGHVCLKNRQETETKQKNMHIYNRYLLCRSALYPR